MGQQDADGKERMPGFRFVAGKLAQLRMALAEYERRLRDHRQKLALGQELLDIIQEGTTLQELQNSAAIAAKIAEKIKKVQNTGEELKQAVIAKRREVEQEMRSEFVAVVGVDREPDMDVLKDEIQRVAAEVAEKEKNCRKLIKEKEHLDHDRKYHKVLKGIAPVHFDKNSTETHVKGYITKADGELHVFEYDLEKEDKCTVADALWDKL